MAPRQHVARRRAQPLAPEYRRGVEHERAALAHHEYRRGPRLARLPAQERPSTAHDLDSRELGRRRRVVVELLAD